MELKDQLVKLVIEVNLASKGQPVILVQQE